MSDNANLRDTIVPKSDQLNADDLIGTTKTITVTAVKRGTPDQPVTINYEGDTGRPYKPCKSMRRVLIGAWGDNGAEWIGRSMTLYCDPEVKFGGVKVGGIRISHLSHIDGDLNLSLTVTRSKRAPYTVRKMQAPQQPAMAAWYDPVQFTAKLPAMREAIASGKMTPEQVIARCEQTGRLTDEQKAAITEQPDPNQPPQAEEVF